MAQGYMCRTLIGSLKEGRSDIWIVKCEVSEGTIPGGVQKTPRILYHHSLKKKIGYHEMREFVEQRFVGIHVWQYEKGDEPEFSLEEWNSGEKINI